MARLSIEKEGAGVQADGLAALGWRWPHPYAWWNIQRCFGHAGGFSVVAYADRTTESGIAIVTTATARSPIWCVGSRR